MKLSVFSIHSLTVSICILIGSIAHAQRGTITDQKIVGHYENAIQKAMIDSNLKCYSLQAEQDSRARFTVESFFLTELESVSVDRSGRERTIVLSRKIGNDLYQTQLETSPDHKSIVSILATQATKQYVNRGTLIEPVIELVYVTVRSYKCEELLGRQ